MGRSWPILTFLFLSAAFGCDEDSRVSQREAARSFPAGTATPMEGDRALFFFSPGCPDCEEVKVRFIPLMERRGIEVEWISVDTRVGLERLSRIESRHGIELSVLAPVMLYRGEVLEDLRAIERAFRS